MRAKTPFFVAAAALVAAALFAGPAAVAGAQIVKNYFDPAAAGGDNVLHIGGTASVESGGVFDLETGGVFKDAGVDVTTDLRAVLGAGLDATELGYLNAVVAGTTAASKALVADANKAVSELRTAALYLGAGAGTAVSATAAELNATASAVSSASTITLGAGGAATQAATFQAKDADGNNIAAVRAVRVFVADDSACATPATAGSNGAVTVSVGAALEVVTAKLEWVLVTDATGAVTLTFDNTGGGGAYAKYVCAIVPTTGAVVASAVTDVATS